MRRTVQADGARRNLRTTATRWSACSAGMRATLRCWWGKAPYYDDDQLSLEGAAFVAGEFVPPFAPVKTAFARLP